MVQSGCRGSDAAQITSGEVEWMEEPHDTQWGKQCSRAGQGGHFVSAGALLWSTAKSNVLRQDTQGRKHHLEQNLFSPLP